jgi:uncharacterized membrane protein YhaH (DUF805 family)
MESKVNPYQAPNAVVQDMHQGEGEKLSMSQIWLSFTGRIPRKVYWLYFFVPMIVVFGMIGGVTAAMGGGREGGGYSIVMAMLQILVIWPSIAVSVKRWHDRDKSGWWVLIGLIPIIGGLWALVENGFLRGTEGSNRFGGDATDLY